METPEQRASAKQRKTLYTEDSLVIDRVITNEYPDGDWQSFSLYTTTEHNEYNAQHKPVLQTLHDQTKARNYESGTLQKKYYTYIGESANKDTRCPASVFGQRHHQFLQYISILRQYAGSDKPAVITTGLTYNQHFPKQEPAGFRLTIRRTRHCGRMIITGILIIMNG
ncbi:MAG: hypothetical protein U5K79_25665 [Cyclobacteriaceae bacterium]|nr:hypothetical protein [Cyclobacteriaceae bacterium]